MNSVCIKECSKHGMTEHGLYGKRWRCKECMVEYDRIKRHKIKQLLVDYKGGCCELCGYNKCLNALEFHHINKENKSFALNTANTNKKISVLKKEADKCILVCATCHREIHYEENENRRKLLIENHLTDNNESRRAYAQNKLVVEDVRRDYENGLYKQDIAEKYNTSLGTVKRFMVKHNICRKHINLTVEEIERFCEHEPTYTNISKMSGFSVKAVKKYCIENNFVDVINKYRAKKGLKILGKKLSYI